MLVPIMIKTYGSCMITNSSLIDEKQFILFFYAPPHLAQLLKIIIIIVIIIPLETSYFHLLMMKSRFGKVVKQLF